MIFIKKLFYPNDLKFATLFKYINDFHSQNQIYSERLDLELDQTHIFFK